MNDENEESMRRNNDKLGWWTQPPPSLKRPISLTAANG
jgi:hypothetical protein